jgi:phosphate transport system ATP-binding protein
MQNSSYRIVDIAERPPGSDLDAGSLPVKIETRDFGMYYRDYKAITDVNLRVHSQKITAIIGPSGCGKSTLLRALNRMNDLVRGTRPEGQVFLDGQPIYEREIDVVDIRRRVGMVFQRPNPFPKSIFDNVAYGPRLYGVRQPSHLAELVEKCLRQAALWDEVKDKLHQSALSLSGGQQQRLCIARAIAVEPEVILMDEPAAALDPISTLRIEELMHDIVKDFTIVIVTHNMQQAARVSDFTAMMMLKDGAGRSGTVIEFGDTHMIFTNPKNKHTEDYVTGRFG